MLPTQKLRTAFRIIPWLCVVAWMYLGDPEMQDYWKGVRIAFLLTAITFGGAILLSGQYKQDKK